MTKLFIVVHHNHLLLNHPEVDLEELRVEASKFNSAFRGYCLDVFFLRGYNVQYHLVILSSMWRYFQKCG